MLEVALVVVTVVRVVDPVKELTALLLELVLDDVLVDGTVELDDKVDEAKVGEVCAVVVEETNVVDDDVDLELDVKLVRLVAMSIEELVASAEEVLGKRLRDELICAVDERLDELVTKLDATEGVTVLGEAVITVLDEDEATILDELAMDVVVDELVANVVTILVGEELNTVVFVELNVILTSSDVEEVLVLNNSDVSGGDVESTELDVVSASLVLVTAKVTEEDTLVATDGVKELNRDVEADVVELCKLIEITELSDDAVCTSPRLIDDEDT